ncbi:hypothetical protein ISN45_Aa06g028580 [Arabidopsis thaliana x Arabidopsis arenosa]|uniref:Uncharacterized protein n=1 Tax=Arabidopsis thaliana x Arabidopsis arenosa TaxID=1240361 RepID=A0A8T1Z2Y2_9BRAS|nr:hypothetical protein ISN45_Aa06g028580 [Arabidopsis thaliana x Arabidopsis arenosa]
MDKRETIFNDLFLLDLNLPIVSSIKKNDRATFEEYQAEQPVFRGHSTSGRAKPPGCRDHSTNGQARGRIAFLVFPVGQILPDLDLPLNGSLENHVWRPGEFPLHLEAFIHKPSCNKPHLITRINLKLNLPYLDPS